MTRLRSESSRSYLGRSARHAAGVVMGVGLRPISKGLDQPPNPTAAQAARHGVTRVVIGQKSAEGIVVPVQAGLLRHSNAQRRSQRIGPAATLLSEGPNIVTRWR